MRQSVEAGEKLADSGYDVAVYEIPDADHGDVVFRDDPNGWTDLPPKHLPGRYTAQLVLNSIGAGLSGEIGPLDVTLPPPVGESEGVQFKLVGLSRRRRQGAAPCRSSPSPHAVPL